VRCRKQDITFILPSGPFLELGAGSGWLAFLLQEAGAEIEAYDLQAQASSSSSASTFIPEWLLWPWSSCVKKGSIEKLQESSSASKTLLLCWPDMETNFATSCLAAYRGSRLVFVGEQRGGETAEVSR
jgi:hypothetical protein